MHLSMLKSQASTLASSARGGIPQPDAVGQRKVELSSTRHDTAIPHMENVPVVYVRRRLQFLQRQMREPVPESLRTQSWNGGCQVESE